MEFQLQPLATFCLPVAAIFSIIASFSNLSKLRKAIS